MQRLAVTPDGLTSPLLQLADDPKASEAAWADFKGVRWVARNTSAKPTATTLLVLPPSTPVVAQQTFGRGQTLYFGTDETYRWRSGVGGKFFARIWSQIIQNFALERMQGASATTQLRTDRAVYFVGDRVKIFGKVFDQEFRPLEDPRIEGELVRQGAEPGTPPDAFPLQAVAENPGLYQGEWLAGAPGVYQFTPLREREAKVNFEVKERNAELLNPALEAEALEGMAKASGGAFLREKELARLPELIDANASTILRQKTLGLYHVLPLLILFLLLLCTEWALRRLWQLK